MFLHLDVSIAEKPPQKSRHFIPSKSELSGAPGPVGIDQVAPRPKHRSDFAVPRHPADGTDDLVGSMLKNSVFEICQTISDMFKNRFENL